MPDTQHIKRTWEHANAGGRNRPDSAWIPAMLNDLAEHMERLERQQHVIVHFLKLGGVSEHDLEQEMNRQLFGTNHHPHD